MIYLFKKTLRCRLRILSVKIKVLGAAGEVGRSGFLVNCDGTNLLLDYGVMFAGKRTDPPIYPLHVKSKDVDATIITHAHLDHSGCVPSLFNGGNTSVYCTPPTLDLSMLLIEDMLKIEKNKHSFHNGHVNSMLRNSKEIGFKEPVKVGNATFELRSSGHVIGGSTVLVEADNKRLFYTGDINPKGSRMLPKADLDIGDIDILITESTYSQTDQMPREESENGLIEFANEVMDRKGILFVPSFSVERSQEIACVLKNVNFKYPVVMDGMALKVNDIMLRYPEYLKDMKIFADVIDDAFLIRDRGDRERAISEPCVVISPAGMLVGGNAVYYMQNLASDDKNGIAIVSYQAEGTPGKKLLETGKISFRGKEMKVKAPLKQFEFSGHGDRTSLFDMIKNIKGDPKVLAVHGDENSCTKFAEEIQEKFGLDAYAPKLGEEIAV
uniref:Beta-lactamase domain-containing protein n=1 Tax=uncultured marine thaumarchaeote KM3_63_D09 TaxID=1456219 RepID=A0A075HEQ5_9ARCH|nr:beta-lactamase domain-containing protein [uncultured marine thaumarchaeote KM3_63_D09]